jgi:hypothetical protein
MSNIKFVVALGAVAAWVGLFACSSSGGTNSCLATALGSDCLSCLQTSCASQLSGVESACSGYLSCACPGGNFSCSSFASSACQQMAGESSCETAEDSFDACSSTSCHTQCLSGGAQCDAGDGGIGTSTTCTGSANLDAGCTNGQPLEFCSSTAGGVTSCYYQVGSELFECGSCTDTTSCAEAANAVCH